MLLDRVHRAESGVALIAAILVIFALLSLSVLFVAMTHTENRVTGAARAFEAAIHVAEGATDQVIARINRSDEGLYTTGHDYSTSGCAGKTGAALEKCESDWVIAKAQEAYASDPDNLITTDVGQAYAVRPHAGDPTTPLSLILGVGFVPNIDNPEKVRVVRLQFDQRSYNPRHAILACGNFEMGGNASITDLSGEGSANVHANGDITTSGSGGSVSVDGKISATGTVAVDSSAATGGTESGAIDEDCPPIEARDFYTRQGDVTTTVDWWDLCPDGVARRPDPAETTPCSNDTPDNHDTLTDGPHLGW
ncbi:MAG: hypothetical protein R3324_13605, partial [Halobacteriales archaeon]|nr:hypothetical protein [Halobacteriales archaeon]